MEIQIDETRRFHKEMGTLPAKEQKRVENSVKKYALSFDTSASTHSAHIFQPNRVVLPGGLEASIYALRATDRLRVILAIDDDPVFGRKLVTLMRVVAHDKMAEAFASIVESLSRELENG